MTMRLGSARTAVAMLAPLLLSGILAGCVGAGTTDTAAETAPPPIPDPTLAGLLELVIANYDFGAMVVDDPVTQRTYPVRLVGTTFFPESEGPHPVVIFLHGRHSFCEGNLLTGFIFSEASLSHCRDIEPVATSIPSHRGYDDVAAILVSHGYVVISIDANDINAQDTPTYATAGATRVPPRGDDGLKARAELILNTLDAFRTVHETGGGPTNPNLNPLQGKLDLDNVGLMGHSRGAEGVTRAPGYAVETGHWSAPSFKAVYALAGATRRSVTAYEAPVVPAPIAYATVLPYCDGDVFNLGGADLHDVQVAQSDHGPLTQLLFMGANHNFYNTEWPQDDARSWAGDAYCAPFDTESTPGAGRLSPDDQRRHHLAYLPAFFRLYLGNETAFLPMFTGEAIPPTACPEGNDTCPDRVHVSHHPRPAARLMIEDASTADALDQNDLGGPTLATGFTKVQWCAPLAPSSACAYPAVGSAPRLMLSWTDNAHWRTEFASTNALAYDALTFRVGVGNDTMSPPNVRVTLEDASGARATVSVATHSAALFIPPGDESERLVLNQVRIPLAAFRAIDLEHLQAISLAFDAATPGSIHLNEVMLSELSSGE